MPKKSYSFTQIGLLKELAEEQNAKASALTAHNLEKHSLLLSYDTKISRLMNKAVLAGVAKTHIAEAVGLANFHVLQNLYAISAHEFQDVTAEDVQNSILPDYSLVEYKEEFETNDGTRGEAAIIHVTPLDMDVLVAHYFTDYSGQPRSHNTPGSIGLRPRSLGYLSEYNVRTWPEQESIPNEEDPTVIEHMNKAVLLAKDSFKKGR